MQEEISADMYKEQPSDGTGLTALYTFKSSDISKATNGKVKFLRLDRCCIRHCCIRQ